MINFEGFFFSCGVEHHVVTNREPQLLYALKKSNLSMNVIFRIYLIFPIVTLIKEVY